MFATVRKNAAIDVSTDLECYRWFGRASLPQPDSCEACGGPEVLAPHLHRKSLDAGEAQRYQSVSGKYTAEECGAVSVAGGRSA